MIVITTPLLSAIPLLLGCSSPHVVKDLGKMDFMAMKGLIYDSHDI
jgi:hypothetical protein